MFFDSGYDDNIKHSGYDDNIKPYDIDTESIPF